MNEATGPAPLSGALLSENPLSLAHRRELVAARDRASSIRKAGRVAAFNGWTTGLCAACSLMFLVFDRSPLAIAIAVGLSIITFNEFRGRKRLLNFDPAAATMLGWNQLGLLAMIVAYCLWQLHTSNSAEAAGALTAGLDSASARELRAMTGGFQLEKLYRTATLALCWGVIALSVVFQGGNAIYYFTRRRHVEDFIAETPQWVRDVQGGSIPV